MMKKEILMRGQTASGSTETLEFSGMQIENKNMAYMMTEFTLYPSTNIGGANEEVCATVTAGKTAITPTDPDFSNEALIGSALLGLHGDQSKPTDSLSVVNDTYRITQNLILMVQETSGASTPVNWQCRFKAVKMNDAEMAANNFKQYTISDGS